MLTENEKGYIGGYSDCIADSYDLLRKLIEQFDSAMDIKVKSIEKEMKESNKNDS